MNSTTQIIQRRIKHYKTSIAGIASIVCPFVSLFLPPEWATKVMAAGLAIGGAGLLGAADAKPTVVTKIVEGVPLLAIVLATFLFSGCSTFKSDQTETAPDGTVRQTAIRARTFMDGRSDLSKLRATTTDKTQGMTIGSLGMESSGSNVVGLVEALSAGVDKGAVRGGIEAATGK